jgi:L-threonylcarbamoyladenylate synthase
VRRWAIRDAPNAAQLDEIADVLRSSGIVLMPTDTIYGLHALSSDARAAGRVAQLKGRDEAKRFVTIAASLGQLESLGADVPEILRGIWPAPLTAVIRCGASTIAARLPDLDWLRTLLDQTGPLLSTSANRSGEAAIADPSDLAPELLRAIDGLVDAGRREGKASTIVDFTETEPRFIREGDRRFAQFLRKRLRK